MATGTFWIDKNLNEVSQRWKDDKDAVRRMSKSHYAYMRQFVREWTQNRDLVSEDDQSRLDLLNGDLEARDSDYVRAMQESILILDAQSNEGVENAIPREPLVQYNLEPNPFGFQSDDESES